jgi:hypothetical protein
MISHCPDLLHNPLLLEVKTHNDNSFKKLKNGVLLEFRTHYIQMQVYMYKMNLQHALYAAVNKNTDQLHMEIVDLNMELAMQYIDRAGAIIRQDTPPPRISDSPGWYQCRICNFYNICHEGEIMRVSCRLCSWSVADTDTGEWRCTNPQGLYKTLNIDEQRRGCPASLPLLENVKTLEQMAKMDYSKESIKIRVDL